MTKRLFVSARQIEAICKGAEKAGHIPEVKIGDAVVRLLPPGYVPDEPKSEIKGKGYL